MPATLESRRQFMYNGSRFEAPQLVPERLRSMADIPRICVVGSSNIDLMFRTPRLPRPGETLTGRDFHFGFGGKGANQAVMAARLGAAVTMITKIGCDVFGEGTLRNYQ